MRQMLDRLLTRLIRQGGLSVIWPNGERSSYGPDKNSPVTIKIAHDRMVRQFVLHPGLAIGEAYMDGSLAPVDCNIYQVLEVLLSNLQAAGIAAVPTLKGRILAGTMVRRLRQINSTVRARRNVAHHYDLNGRLYSLFLDRDRQYSCAYFRTGDETLEEAQAAKKRHIAAKLLLDRPGLTVLDIGCGWGGMALTLARDYGAARHRHHPVDRAARRGARRAPRPRVCRTGCSSSCWTTATVTRRVRPHRLGRHVRACRRRPLPAASSTCVEALLTPDGVALLHAIGRQRRAGRTNPWIAQIHLPRRLLPGACPR